MTDRHRPSSVAALSRYLTEASVYVLVTSVGADCYVCILSHSAIALRCALPVPSTTNLPPTPFSSPAPNYLQSVPNGLALPRLCAHLLTFLSIALPAHLFTQKLKHVMKNIQTNVQQFH